MSIARAMVYLGIASDSTALHVAVVQGLIAHGTPVDTLDGAVEQRRCSRSGGSFTATSCGVRLPLLRAFTQQTQRSSVVATSTISMAWPESSKFESQAGVARPKGSDSASRPVPQSAPTFDRS